MTSAEARFNKSLRPRKPEGSLGRTAQDVHLDSHTDSELSSYVIVSASAFILTCVSLLLQRQQPVSSEEKDVMTLLSLLLSMRRQRKHSPDVIPETDDVMGRDVRLRKRQRQCYWSVVTCY